MCGSAGRLAWEWYERARNIEKQKGGARRRHLAAKAAKSRHQILMALCQLDRMARSMWRIIIFAAAEGFVDGRGVSGCSIASSLDDACWLCRYSVQPARHSAGALASEQSPLFFCITIFNITAFLWWASAPVCIAHICGEVLSVSPLYLWRVVVLDSLMVWREQHRTLKTTVWRTAWR